MPSNSGKSSALSSAPAQMIFVIIAFVIMVVVSFIYVSDIERKHLINDANNSIAFTEAEIMASFIEAESYLNGYSETIRRMILEGVTLEEMTNYITYITTFALNDEERLIGLSGTHGYFHTWGGEYICGKKWIPLADYAPQETNWYKAAVEANGKITIIDPHEDAITGNMIISFSRLISDDDGNPLGVISLDLGIDRIYKFATEVHLTPTSYGLILNNKIEVIAHPDAAIIGKRLNSISSGLAQLDYDISSGLDINERRVKNYMSDESIVFFKRIINGWRLGIVIPVREYYKNVNSMAAFLIILGGILAGLLCLMLYSISQAKKKSDLKTQQKSNFLATMSHEIRTPLNAILGITDIQMQNITHPPGTSEAFIKINNSGNLLLSIINDILDLSKIESGKLELTPEKYEVASMLNDTVQLNNIRYENKSIEFKIEVDENIPSILVGDELRIKQILNNLLSNAFKYTDSGSVTLSAGADCVGRGGIILVTLIFQITDTGQGMTPQQVSKLFDENTRLDMEANRTTEGAGLGLTITRNLLNLMHGKISVKSTVGEGTSVTVRIPQRTDGVGIRGVIGKEMAESLQHFKVGNAIQIKKSQITHEHMPYGKVLIVDDVETNLFVAKGLMTPYVLNIDSASSGSDALEKS
jgi:signal transduction histidine kinase